MKKGIIIFLSVFLSALIVYGGSGVNAYFYCCNDCRDEGSAAVVQNKCCEIHHHHHFDGAVTHYDDHACETFFTENHDACGVNRIWVDWQSHTANQTPLQPQIIYHLFNHVFLMPDEVAQAHDIAADAHFLRRQTQKPPDLSKDDYFSLLTTLLI